jgi:hypothetical protein
MISENHAYTTGTGEGVPPKAASSAVQSRTAPPVPLVWAGAFSLLQALIPCGLRHIVSGAIPLLAHVLLSAWRFSGDKQMNQELTVLVLGGWLTIRGGAG